MDQSQLNRLIETLKHVRKRPGMYFTDDMASIDNFVSGFYTALAVFADQTDSEEIYSKLLQEKGLQHNRSIYQQLKEKGYNDAEAIYEYLTLLIEDCKQHKPNS